MKATAQRVARPSSARTASSARGLGGPGGTTCGRPGSRGGGVRRPITSNAAAVTKSLALAFTASQSRADREADGHERGRAEEPGDDPLRNRADVAERPPAAVVRVLRVLDVADDRVELAIRDR